MRCGLGRSRRTTWAKLGWAYFGPQFSSPGHSARATPWEYIVSRQRHLHLALVGYCSLSPVQSYTVTSPCRKPRMQILDLIFNVKEVTTPTEVRTVLVVKVNDSQHWDHGREAVIQQVGHQAEHY